MKRLTNKNLTKACNDPWDYCGLDSVCTRDCHKPIPCKIPKTVHRLAEIEDILGDDYDLDRLRELVEADRDGRCFLFPKDGDMFNVDGVEHKADHWNVYLTAFSEDGHKLALLSVEAAEAALKGEQDG